MLPGDRSARSVLGSLFDGPGGILGQRSSIDGERVGEVMRVNVGRRGLN